MTVGSLLKEIKRCQKLYGKDFLGWAVYTEQLHGVDKKYKKGPQKWDWAKDSEGWEYFDCAGFNTIFEDKKIFTINVNF